MTPFVTPPLLQVAARFSSPVRSPGVSVLEQSLQEERVLPVEVGVGRQGFVPSTDSMTPCRALTP